jgi:hypothetical protein
MTTDPHRVRGGGLLPTARHLGALLALVIVAVACSQDAAGPAPTTQTESDAPATTATTVEQVDLRAAIGAVGDSYTFETIVVVGQTVLTEVSGRVDGDSSTYIVSTGGSAVEYVVTPEGRWVREPDEAWVPLREAAPGSNPLAVLLDPDDVAVTGEVGTTTILTATYAGSDLEIDADTVSVEFVVSGGLVTSLSYDAPTASESVASVTTVIAPTPGAEPILPPVTG